MTKENPFTVPEGYFEDARARIYAGAEKIHRRRKSMTLALSCFAAVVVVVVGAQWTYKYCQKENLVSEAEIWNCISDYDIYLQLGQQYENE